MKPSTFVTVLALWIASFYASSLMAYAEFISLWYIPAGVSFAAFLVFDKRAFFPIFLASWFVSFHFAEQFNHGFDPTHLAISVLFALVHTLSYAIGGLIARYWLSQYTQKPMPLKIISLLLCFVGSALLAAFSGLLVWEFTTETNDNIIETGWYAWWLGDLIGAIVITPILVLLFPKIAGQKLPWLDVFFEHDDDISKGYRSFASKLAFAILTIILIMLLDQAIEHTGVAYFIFFVTIPQLWIVFTERTSYASVSLVVITSIMAFGVGLFNVTDQAMTYQFALFVMAMMSYFAVSVPVLSLQNNRLKKLAMMDLLTQLPTRWLAKLLVEQVIKSSKPNQNHSLALFNIDKFSELNRDYGESVGDAVLQQLATIIKSEMRDSEILCRCDDDNFIVFMPNLDLVLAKQRAEELRHKMPVLKIDDLILPIRSSFGVVQVQLGESFEEIAERAHQAMKQAKQNGRNKVFSFA